MFTRTKRAGARERRPPTVPTQVLNRENAHRERGVEAREGDETTWEGMEGWGEE